MHGGDAARAKKNPPVWMSAVSFVIVGAIENAETIATSRGIRELRRVKKAYGPGRWRKRKGVATVRLEDGTLVRAEVHWYEAHGIGRRGFKIKTLLDE